MEGLDITVLKLSEVRTDNEKFRIDDGYFAKLSVLTQHRVEALPNVRLGAVCSVFRKGIFDIKSSSYAESGIPFVRIGDLRDGLIDTKDLAFISPAAHAAEGKTCLHFGDIVLSKTAYAAASFVSLAECNVSQDTIAVRLSPTGRKVFKSGYIVAYLNSRYGLALMTRHFQGNVQLHLSLPDGRKVPVPTFGEALQGRTDQCVRNALEQLSSVDSLMANATSILTVALGLGDWRPPEPLTYTGRASEAFASRRIDAEYFHPAKRALLERLRAQRGKPLEAHYETIREMFDPRAAKVGECVRNFDLTDALSPVLDDDHPCMPAREVGSVKKRLVAGDVVISRLRAYLREIALVRTTSAVPSIGSSEFIVLRPRAVGNPALSRSALLVFLRSHAVQTILKWSQDGSHHPRFGDEDLLRIPVPDAVCAIAPEVEMLFERILRARARARDELARAKRAIEIAIEKSEADALSYLKTI